MGKHTGGHERGKIWTREMREQQRAQQTGFQATERAATCFKCGGIFPCGQLIKGWCVSCMAAWTATADPLMLSQARLGYTPQSCLPAPTTRQEAAIAEAIIAPKNDAEFLPLLHFLGNPTVGRMQALWNFAKTMEALELKTTGEVLRLTKASHDTTHRTGLHAPVQKSTLDSFLSRVFYAENFKPLARDVHLKEYLEWFIEANRIWLFERTRISEGAFRTRQAWRKLIREKRRPLVEYWPFLQTEESGDHRELLAVDAAIPKGIPEQWRQDMCQEMMVAVLSGEITLDNLKDRAADFIKRVWRQHPIKFGDLSLDAPPPWSDGGRTLGDTLSDIDIEQVTDCKYHDDTFAMGGWHEGFDRPLGLARMADVLRDKHNGILPLHNATEGEENDPRDEEIAEVYNADRRPTGYRPDRHAVTAHPERIRRS